MESEKFAALLENQLVQLKSIPADPNNEKIISNLRAVRGWITCTLSLLEREFDENSTYIKAIREMNKLCVVTQSGARFHKESLLSSGNEILSMCIQEIQTLGVRKDKTKGTGVNVNVSQAQNQTINLNLFIEALTNELDEGQQKTLKLILEAKEPTGPKQRKLRNFFESLTTNTTSSILANIFCNPATWNALQDFGEKAMQNMQ